ncbi:hypothetical protein R5O97_05870 [Citrobacter freundii]|nr:hypothetical protein R5O97_05870 [Citrobacter freundii]
MSSREKFEQAIKARFGDSIDYRVCKNSDGEYMAWDMQVAWWAWQAAETELAVQLANAESKCRELAAECKTLSRFISGSCYVFDGDHDDDMPDEFIDASHYMPIVTPATDAFLAEVRASAIRDALNESSDYLDTDCVMDRLDISYEDAELRTSGAIELHDALVAVANQLRKGE